MDNSWTACTVSHCCHWQHALSVTVSLVGHCCRWQGRKTLSRCVMTSLHNGHKSSRGAQLPQQTTWPHGTNAVSTSASAQIWHRIESRHFTIDSLISCTQRTRHSFITSITSFSSNMGRQFCLAVIVIIKKWQFVRRHNISHKVTTRVPYSIRHSKLQGRIQRGADAPRQSAPRHWRF